MSIRELIARATKAILPTRLVSLDKVSLGNCTFARTCMRASMYRLVPLACFEDEFDVGEEFGYTWIQFVIKSCWTFNVFISGYDCFEYFTFFF